MADTDYFDHPNDGFNLFSAPVITDDQHNPNACFSFDELDDWMNHTDIPIGSGESKYTITGWINTNPAIGGTKGIINQRPGSYTGTAYDITLANNGSFAVAHRENNNSKNISSASSASAFSLDTWFWFGAAIDVTNRTIDIAINGIEVSYSVHSALVGLPSATTITMTKLGVGSIFNDSFLVGAEGEIARMRFKPGTLFSMAQMLIEFNAEFAKIGEGFGSNTSLYPDGATPRVSLYPG